MEYAPVPSTPAPRRRQTFLLAAMVMLAVLVVVLSPGSATPASASFSIDTSGLMDQASSMFNSIWPVFGVIVGISVGVALAILIASKFVQAFKAGR
jgi:hypothetical protein